MDTQGDEGTGRMDYIDADEVLEDGTPEDVINEDFSFVEGENRTYYVKKTPAQTQDKEAFSLLWDAWTKKAKDAENADQERTARDTMIDATPRTREDGRTELYVASSVASCVRDWSRNGDGPMHIQRRGRELTLAETKTLRVQVERANAGVYVVREDGKTTIYREDAYTVLLGDSRMLNAGYEQTYYLTHSTPRVTRGIDFSTATRPYKGMSVSTPTGTQTRLLWTSKESTRPCRYNASFTCPFRVGYSHKQEKVYQTDYRLTDYEDTEQTFYKGLRDEAKTPKASNIKRYTIQTDATPEGDTWTIGELRNLYAKAKHPIGDATPHATFLAHLKTPALAIHHIERDTPTREKATRVREDHGTIGRDKGTGQRTYIDADGTRQYFAHTAPLHWWNRRQR
jgi:hypothetical protein